MRNYSNIAKSAPYKVCAYHQDHRCAAFYPPIWSDDPDGYPSTTSDRRGQSGLSRAWGPAASDGQPSCQQWRW